LPDRSLVFILQELTLISSGSNMPAVEPTAKSLILDLLSTIGDRSMPVRALVAAADLFDIEENSLRVALARLLAADTVERDERGEYRLGRRAAAVQQQVRSWRRIENRVRQWNGGWLGVHTGALRRESRATLERRRRALRFLGFRELVPGLAVRPDNLTASREALYEELVALGLPAAAPVFAMAMIDRASDAAARALWDGEALVTDYRRSRAELEESEARLPDVSAREAMVESFLLGGRVIRQIVLDPLLPEPIVPDGELRELVTAMRRYDKLGHSCWRAFFSQYRLTSMRAPVHSEPTHDVEALPAA
jgi:phenylacetic acid degradation operon negative regulatory protein